MKGVVIVFKCTKSPAGEMIPKEVGYLDLSDGWTEAIKIGAPTGLGPAANRPKGRRCDLKFENVKDELQKLTKNETIYTFGRVNIELLHWFGFQCTEVWRDLPKNIAGMDVCAQARCLGECLSNV